MEADFSGYATKAGLKCSDGRTITPDAFKHQDKITVPLVWQHGHDDPKNVLGHAILEARDDGMYAYGFFNSTEQAKATKILVQHKDVNSLSIWANNLVEKVVNGSKQVLHGAIRELSLVLSGANPGAKIDYVRVAHSDGEVETLSDEAIIFTGLELEHENPVTDTGQVVIEDKPQLSDLIKNYQEPVVVETVAGGGGGGDTTTAVHATATGTEVTFQDIYDSLTEDQKAVVHYMITAALESAKAAATAQHSGDAGDSNNQKGSEMNHNVFEGSDTKVAGPTLSHDQLKAIVEDAQKLGSLKESFLAHAVEYGIEDIDLLFPDAKTLTSSPDFISRRMEWVSAVLDGAKHSPFSRIKSLAADITAEEARAKGYVKGAKKKEEIIKLLRRVTTPTTVYKKQKLDRDDIVDITDLDVVAWLKAEMRVMLDEELARAALIGDGREPDDPDKIDEEKVRPIAWDDEMYAHTVTAAANTTPEGYVEYILRARKFYKGSGTPSLFTTDDIITDMMLLKDKMGRRLYNTEAELAAALRVKELVPVEVMENTPDLLAVIVNMVDYTFGADRGGQLGMFDDFDIDYNQYKYLLESRVSGCLTKPKSAVVLKRTSGTTVTPTAPTFVPATNTITIPVITGVSYFNVTNPLSESEMSGDVVITETTDVEARADTGYNFPHNIDADWTFAYTAS